MDKFNEVKASQSLNIELIFVTLEVLNDDRSRLVNL